MGIRFRYRALCAGLNDGSNFTERIVKPTESSMCFSPKKSLAIAAALPLTGGTASAAAVITGGNLDNVVVSTAAANTPGASTINDGAGNNTGRVTFAGDEANSPGLKIVNDDPLLTGSGSNGVNCIMANSGSSKPVSASSSRPRAAHPPTGCSTSTPQTASQPPATTA